jgi:ferredoxin
MLAHRPTLLAATAHPVFTARVEPDGAVFGAPASLPLLQAAELAGVTLLASSCRNGTCRTCICQLMSGQVVYRIEWPGLSLDEKREGYILPCVAYPVSDVVMELPF